MPASKLDLARLGATLIKHEGCVLKMYEDSRRIKTIGVGHNLEKVPISKRAALVILEDDINNHLALLDKYLPWWRTLDGVRQEVLANMAFNLGVGPTPDDPDGKLLTFKNTLRAMEEHRYDAAADGMLASTWATQVGRRAGTLAAMMRSGIYQE